MQEVIAVQIKVCWSYWSLLGPFTVPQVRQHNRMVLTNKQKVVIENDFNEKGCNSYRIWKKNLGFECSCMAVHNLIKKSRLLGRQSVAKEASDPLSQQQKKAHQFWGACVFARRWTWYPQFHQANHTSDIDQQIISSWFGQEKESSLLQTFKNTSASDEFGMP